MLPCRGILKERTDRRDRRAWHKDEAAQEELKGAIEAVLHELHNEHHEVPFLAQYRKEVRSKCPRAPAHLMGESAEQQRAKSWLAGRAKNSMYTKVVRSERPALHSMHAAGTSHGKWDVRACAVPSSTRLLRGGTAVQGCSAGGNVLPGRTAVFHRRLPCSYQLYCCIEQYAQVRPAACTDMLETVIALLKLCSDKCPECSKSCSAACADLWGAALL